MILSKKAFILISCVSFLLVSGCNKKDNTPPKDNQPVAVAATATDTIAAPENSEFNCTDVSWIDGLQTDLKDRFSAITKASVQSSQHNVDMNQLQQWDKLIHFRVTDIRTDKANSTDNKISCSAVLAADLPQPVLVNAYRAQNRGNNQCTDFTCMLQSFVEEATNQEISLESAQLSQNYNYSIEKSDSGSLVISRDTDPRLSKFLRNLLTSALYLPAYEEEDRQSGSENEQMEQELEEKYQLIADAMEIRLNELNNSLAKKTDQLNTMWENKPKEFQAMYLANQKAWFKKRDVECRIEAQKPYHEIDEKNREQYAFETDEWPTRLIDTDKEIRFKKCVAERIEYRMNQLSEMK